MRGMRTAFVIAATMAAVLAVGASGVASAQNAGDPTTAVVVSSAPMFYLKDTSRTPMRMLPSGTQVRVIAKEGGFYKVVVTDPRWGDETGYVTVASLRIQTGGSSQPTGGGFRWAK